MSANTQTLVVEHDGKFLVFSNVNAESWYHWDDERQDFDTSRVNEIEASAASRTLTTRREALEVAHDLEAKEPTEYGVHEVLAKDGSAVHIT